MKPLYAVAAVLCCAACGTPDKTTHHVKQLKKAYCYLKTHYDRKIYLKPTSLDITCDADSSFANHYDKRSQECAIWYMGGAFLAIKSRVSKQVADSSAEAETGATRLGAKRGLYFINVLRLSQS